MMNKWYNSNAAQMAGMVDVSDDMIRFFSAGEVKKEIDGGKELEFGVDELNGTLDDIGIFKAPMFSDGEGTMGHIELCAPIVNIQFFRGRRPMLAGLLGMDFSQIERIIYFQDGVVIASGSSAFAKGQIIPIWKKSRALEEDPELEIRLGAEAIDWMLAQSNIRGREKMVLHCLPVMPLELRYCPVVTNKTVLISNGLQTLYGRVLTRNLRLARLQELNAPGKIIEDAARLLQQACDTLINNGAGASVFTDEFEMPIDSLHEINSVMMSRCPGQKRLLPQAKIDVNAIVSIARRIRTIHEEVDLMDDEATISQDANNQLNKNLEDICTIVSPFYNEYMNTNFSRYKRFAPYILQHVFTEGLEGLLQKILWLVETDKLEIERIRHILEESLMKKTDWYIDKRLKWDVFNDGGDIDDAK